MDTIFLTHDDGYMVDAEGGTILEPRCDIDDDGDVDSDDLTAYAAKKAVWPNPSWNQPTVSQAFGDVGNPYMFQGVPHFAIDTAANATSGKYMLNHHRARFADPVIGRWLTRDPLVYNFELLDSDVRLLKALAGSTDDTALNLDKHSLFLHSARWFTVFQTSNRWASLQENTLQAFSSNPISSCDPTGLSNSDAECCARSLYCCCHAMAAGASALHQLWVMNYSGHPAHDPMRHCLSSCLTVKASGRTCAAIFWDCREEPGTTASEQADLHNNMIGRSVANGNCWLNCKEKYNQGELRCPNNTHGPCGGTGPLPPGPLP